MKATRADVREAIRKTLGAVTDQLEADLRAAYETSKVLVVALERAGKGRLSREVDAYTCRYLHAYLAEEDSGSLWSIREGIKHEDDE
jgi:hypothetical protein